MSEKLTPEEFLKKLSENLEYDRSDISNIIDDFLEDGSNNIEGKFDERYVTAKIPDSDITIEYDTFTGTLHSKKLLESWNECIDYEFRADEVI